MTYQGQNYIFKHYCIIIWCIVNALFSDEITCHTPNYNIRQVPVDNTDHRIRSDGIFDDKITKSPWLIKIKCAKCIKKKQRD